MPKSHGLFYDMIMKENLFQRYFKFVTTSNNLELIKCESIKRRCMLTELNDLTFLTELEYEFDKINRLNLI